MSEADSGLLAPDVQTPRFFRNLRRVIERRETIRFMVTSNLKAGHRDKVLGNVWSLLDPLMFICIFLLVFGFGLRQAGDSPWEYGVYLSAGILAFNFTDGVIAQAAVCLRSHQGLLHEVYFPKAIIPISLCFSRLYDFFWGLLVLSAALLLTGTSLTMHVAWLPLIIILHVMLCLGLAFLVAYVGAFFADTANIVAVVMRILFFASPIFYYTRSELGHESIVPERFLQAYMLNPIAGLLNSYRDALVWGRAPDFGTLAYVGGFALVTLVLGFAVFSRGEGHYAKYV